MKDENEFRSTWGVRDEAFDRANSSVFPILASAPGTDSNNGIVPRPVRNRQNATTRNLRKMVINRDRIGTKSFSMSNQDRKKIFSARKDSPWNRVR